CPGTLGQKAKLQRSDIASSSKDICTLLRVTPQLQSTKIAPVRKDSDIASEERETEDFSFPITQSETRANPKPQLKYLPVGRQTRPNLSLEQTPASKAYIQNLLKEMKALFAADIALVWEDLGAITARLQALEVSGEIAKGRQDDQQSEMDKFKQANLLME
ncbi:Hypothetical predicted protein, partial [Pelobates cultripes]